MAKTIKPIEEPLAFAADSYGSIKRLLSSMPGKSFQRAFIADPVGQSMVTSGELLPKFIERARTITKTGESRTRDLYNVYKANVPDPKDYKAFKSWTKKADDAFRPAIKQNQGLVENAKKTATKSEKLGSWFSKAATPLEIGLGLMVDAAFLGLEGWEASQNVEQSEQQAMLESMKNPQAMAQDKFAQVLMKEMGMPGGVAQQAPPAQAPASPSNAQQAQQALAAVMGAQQSSGLASGETVIGE